MAAVRLRGPSVVGVYFGQHGYCVRFKDGSVQACSLACPVMLPIGFVLQLKTVSGKHYAVPVLKAGTEAVRVSSRQRLVAVLSGVIGWAEDGLRGVAALIWMVKIIMQTPTFLTAQSGTDD